MKSATNELKLKRLGFPRFLSIYKQYNPSLLSYLNSKDHGYFEAPKRGKNRELRHLVNNYKTNQEFDKYLNPKGYKLTWTSNYPKNGDQIDYINTKCFLTRTEKKYNVEPNNLVKFRVDKDLSKPEIRQIVSKLYNVNVLGVNTSIIPGEVKRRQQSLRFYRTRDYKNALVATDFEIDPKNLYLK